MEKPWIKLWTRWYETMSHAKLKPEALHTGPHLLVIAGKYGRREDGSAALVGPDGEPLRITDLARMTRWSTKKMADIIADLRRVKTLEVDGDAYVFPQFARWQDGDSTKRTRRHRASRERSRNGAANVPSAVPGTTEDRVRGQRTELEHPPTPQGDGWVEVAKVCDRLPWISAKGVTLLSPRDRIHRLVVAGATADEIVRTLEGLAVAVDAGKEPTGHWNAQYVFSGHYDRLRTAYGSGTAPEAETPQETLRRLKGAS